MQETDSIHGMNVVNSDVTYDHSQTPEKCLETSDKEDKKKYLDNCLK